MISAEEMDYLFWLARDLWSGAGDIIEIGPWLGGSTWCLASGMEASPRRDAASRLHVVDNFRWRPFMGERASLPLKPDESFRAYFEANLSAKLPLLVIHEASLPDDDSAVLAHPGGVRTSDSAVPLFTGEALRGDVAVLFVDGAKSWSALRHLLRELAPRFVVGETLLVLQDFQNWLAYWVPMALALVMRTVPDALVPLHTLRFNTVTFRVLAPLGQEALDQLPPTIDDLSVEKGTELLAEAAAMLRGRGERSAASVAELATVAFLGTKGIWREALVAFRAAEARWPWSGAALNQLVAARAWVAEGVGAPVPPSTHARRVARAVRAAQLAAGAGRRLRRAAEISR